MQNTTFNYEIIEKIAVLSKNGDVSKELNKVSYNNTPAKYDLRNWKRENGEEKLLKGITLNKEETKALKDALNSKTDI